MKSNKFFIVLLLILTIPALKAIAIPDFYTSHDGLTHTARISNYYLALKEGQLPPRLAPNLFGSLGFPIFIFIYPIPYLLGAIFHYLGFSFTDSFEIVIGLSFVISGISMFYFAKKMFGDIAAFFAAVFYTWAPYRFSQIYVRGAIAESFAYIFIPIILLSLIEVSETKKNKQLWLSIGGFSLAGMLLSHQLVSAMFLPIILLFGLYLLLSCRVKTACLKNFIVIALLGFLISAFIYLPSLFERKYLQFDNLINYYQDHFVTIKQLIHSPWSYGFSMKGTESDDMSFQIGLTHLLVVVFTSLYLFYRIVQLKLKIFSNKSTKLGIWLHGLFIFIVLLMIDNPMIMWIWENIPGINTIDIPWRLLGVAVFLSSLLSAYLVDQTKNKFLMLILIFFVFYANRNHLRINKTVVYDDDFFIDYRETATWQNEFLPKWRKTNKWQNLEKDYYLEANDVDIKPLNLSTTDIQLKINSEKESKIALNKLYFPGWTYFLDGKKLELSKDFEISESIQLETESKPYVDRSGMPVISIPQGEHLLQAKFKSTVIRKIGYLLSITGLVLSVLLLFKAKMFSKLIQK